MRKRDPFEIDLADYVLDEVDSLLWKPKEERKEAGVDDVEAVAGLGSLQFEPFALLETQTDVWRSIRIALLVLGCSY
jgi:hypothetical protein